MISTLTRKRARGHEHDTHLVLKIPQHGQHIRIAHLLSSSVVVVVLFVMTECHHCPILLLRVGVGSGSSGGGIPTKVVPNRNARSSSSHCHRRTSCATAAAAGVEKEARGGLFEDVVGMVKHFLYFEVRAVDRRTVGEALPILIYAQIIIMLFYPIFLSQSQSGRGSRTSSSSY